MTSNKEKTKKKLFKYKDRIILIDSSLLMLPIAGKRRQLNIEEALYSASEGGLLAILDSTLEELKILREKTKGKKRLAADFALELVKRMKLPVLRVNEIDPNIKREVEELKKKLKKWEFHDEILARTAEKIKAIVATTDMELVRRLRKRGVPVLYLRAGKWLVIE